MEFVEGRTLKAQLEENFLPALNDISLIMGGLLAGLAYSHSHQVVHRDIKPANVIVTADGFVKIADFGIARIGGSSMTLIGTIMGTPAYMSPEQFKGNEIDFRTDIYSAGVVLFQLLTGKRPFEGNMATIMQAVLKPPAPRPSGIVSKVSPALDAVVARAMAYAPADRFPTAAAFDQALQAALRAKAAPLALPAGLGDDDATIVRPTQPRPPAPKPSVAPNAPLPGAKPRSRMPLVLAGTAVLLLAASGAGYMLFGRAPVEPDNKPPKIATHTTKPPEKSSQDPEVHSVKPDVATNSSGGSTKPPLHEQDTSTQASSGSGTTPGDSGSNPPTQTSDASANGTVPAQFHPLPLGILVAALEQVACSAATTDEQPPGTVRVMGVATASGDRMLHEAIQNISPGAPTDWQVTIAHGPYCGVLDALRPYVRATGRAAIAVALPDGRTVLVKDDLMVPQIVMPDFSANLELDYLSNDGGVVHLAQATPGNPYLPGATAVFGRAEDKGQTYPVDEPYGTDLIIAIASGTPLFKTARSQIETLDTYLKNLQTALDQAAAKGTRLSAATLLEGIASTVT